MIWSSAIDAVLSSGAALQHLGISNWALDRAGALAAVSRLADLGVPILGGDVYVIRSGMPESTYDNWYCDRGPSESDREFVNRSADMAKRYLTDYLSPTSDALFALVPGKEVFSAVLPRPSSE